MRVHSARWACAVAIAVAFAFSGAANLAHAADSGMCAFIKKVLATRSADFAPLKGAENTDLGNDRTMFDGTLTPAPDQKCTLFVRRRLNANSKDILTPKYSCTIAKDIDYDTAEARYAELATAIKSCLPGWKYEEKKNGDRAKREEAWSLTGTKSGASIEVGFYDWSALADLFNRTTSTKPGVAVSLDFENLGAGPKGAAIPAMHSGTK